jgi:hypothetical protein
MRQALELVREAIHRVDHTTHETPSEPSPGDTPPPPPEPTNAYYREMLSDSWYHFKPDQHISYLKLRWEDPNNPVYARYLKPEVRAGNPTLLGSMGPGEPVYADNLLAQPYHAAEPRGTTPQSFDLLANPLDPRIDRAIASLGDLGVTSEVFRLRQLPMRRLENARHAAYLEREKERIQREIGYLELGRKQLDTEEANIRRRLSAARVFMRISDHLEYDMEPGEVPHSVLYPRLTNRPARYNVNTRSPATALRAAGGARRGNRGARGQRMRARTPRSPCLYCRSTAHDSSECTQPHRVCTAEECLVTPIHTRYEPRYVCPYFAAHTSGRMTAEEEAFAMEDLYMADSAYMGSD